MQKAISTLIFACFLSANHAAHSQTADLDAVRAGDRWSYTITDDATGDLRDEMTVVVIDVTKDEINTRVSYRGKDRPRAIIYDLNWGRIDDSLWKFTSGQGGIQKPIEVGKEWRSETAGSNFKTGTILKENSITKIVAKEPITTPAGTFETFRIQQTSQQVNTNDQTKSSENAITMWYAPQINRWVRKKIEIRMEGRLRDSYSEELKDFSRKP